MAKKSKSRDDLSDIAQLLQNLLAIELWRGGLSQVKIAKRVGVATKTVNGMLKGVSRGVTTLMRKEA